VEKTIFTRHYGVLVKKMRAMREAAGLNQRELARLLKREQTLVARIEQGQRRIDMIEFYSFCRALGVDVRQAATELYNECLALDKPTLRRKKAKR
jgi:transcriptional regulator with XRE-family HTH domain